MPRENTLEASRHLKDINALLREIEESLKQPRQINTQNV